MWSAHWWAHLQFTCINIELTILPKEFEETQIVRALNVASGGLPFLSETKRSPVGERRGSDHLAKMLAHYRCRTKPRHCGVLVLMAAWRAMTGSDGSLRRFCSIHMRSWPIDVWSLSGGS
jgi:hypothetical protein